MTMTPAEFRCAREHLGLPAQWLAAHLGVNTRTIWQWERPTSTPPVYASKAMQLLLDGAEHIVGILTVKTQGDAPLPVPVGNAQSPSKFPDSYWRAIASRVSERTSATLVYGDLEKLARKISSETKGDSHATTH